jgi:hypothetical protein
MATKTISVRIEAYEKLRTARRYPTESFSEVILRAHWPEETVTAAEWLHRSRESGPRLTAAELDRIDALKVADAPPEDKWKKR